MPKQLVLKWITGETERIMISDDEAVVLYGKGREIPNAEAFFTRDLDGIVHVYAWRHLAKIEVGPVEAAPAVTTPPAIS